MWRPAESDDVYRALVSGLSLTVLPTSIMGVTLVGLSLFAHLSTGHAGFLLAVLIGGGASAAKIALLALHRRRDARVAVGFAETRRWEAMHAFLTMGMAMGVGLSVAIMLGQQDQLLHMLATALAFGYAAGIVGRISIRPWLAAAALVVSVVPAIVALAHWPDAAHRLVALMFAVFLIGGLENVRHVYRAATGQIATRLEMEGLARRDPLTGLVNRFGLRSAFREAAAGSGDLAVHCLDLDGFKAVNDRFGHAAGDATLLEVAARLRALMPERAVVVRLGGDEFVILQPDVHDRSDADMLARRMVRALCEPFPVAGGTATIGASLGYTICAAPLADLDAMLRDADEASYRIKRSGGGVASPPGLSGASERIVA